MLTETYIGGGCYNKKNAFNSRGVLFLVFIGLAVTVAALAKSSQPELTEVAEEKITTDIVATLDVPEATNEAAISQQLTEQNTTLEMPSSTQSESSPEPRPPLAAIVNGKSIDDDPYAQEYLRLRGFFGNLPLETVDKDSSAVFNAGNVPEDIKGFVINNKIYAIHLVLCAEEHNSCYLRVNGVPTSRITTKDSEVNDAAKFFTLEEEYRLEVNSIQFNYCGTYRFCDMRHEAYDVVNVSIVNSNDE